MSKSNGQDPKQDQQELAMHQEGMRAMQEMSRKERARLLEATVESELEATSDGLDNLKAKDFPLANYDDEADVHEFKWLQEIILEFQRAKHPHPDSVLQGPIREWAFDDPTASLEALDMDEFIQDETYFMGTFSRATRGEDGFQQETNAKQVRESYAVNEGNDGGGGGLLGRFRS